MFDWIEVGGFVGPLRLPHLNLKFTFGLNVVYVDFLFSCGGAGWPSSG